MMCIDFVALLISVISLGIKRKSPSSLSSFFSNELSAFKIRYIIRY